MTSSPPPKLCNATLAAARAEVRRPAYDRATLKTGVVHLGPGAFHRAHQAAYFDDLNEMDPRWGIVGASLRSVSVQRTLEPQDNLYTLATLDADVEHRIIGVHTGFLTATESANALLRKLADPDVSLVTLTVTEKGYCLGPDGRLDLNHPDIFRDITGPERPTSAIGWIVEGLRRRRADGVAPFHVLSCDNLAANGEKLRAAVLDLAEIRDPDLAAWVADAVRFPSSMVDSITPATNDALRGRVREAIGLVDAWPVQREAFTSWVIERADIENFPDLAAVGAVMTSDVAGHEQAKLRLLNGAHSSLAYIGLARGHVTVADVMADPDLAAFVDRLMTDEITPSLRPPQGLDLAQYAADIRGRFRNPAIRHELAQIAWDGSQKLPIRVMGTIADNLDAGRPIGGLAAAVAAWMRFVRRRAREGGDIVDPNAEVLRRIGAACADAPSDVGLFLDRSGVAAERLRRDARFEAALRQGYADMLGLERAGRFATAARTGRNDCPTTA